MNLLERASVTVRHAPLLERADWLWERVRPTYDRFLQARYRTCGLPRVINGEPLMICPAARGLVSESYEPELWRRLMDEVGPGDQIAEVGASIGLYALAFAHRVGATGHVFAFEPDPPSASVLAANLAVNGIEARATLVQAAAAGCDGEIGFASGRGVESRISSDCETSIRVPSVRLDTFFASARVDLMKIDVEGFEEAVLRGTSDLLADRARRPRLIAIEVHPFLWHLLGTTGDSLLALLEAADYRVETLEGLRLTHISDYGHIVAVAN